MKVYAYYDDYDNLLYITKEYDPYASYLKDYEKKEVKRVRSHSFKSDTDASVMKAALIAYYKPPFNKQGIWKESEIVTSDMIESLVWCDGECHQSYVNDEKDDLVNKLRDFEKWDSDDQIRTVENAYKEYILDHLSDTDEYKRKYEHLFEVVFVKAMGFNYRRQFCNIIKSANLPNLEMKWYDFSIKRMNVRNFSRYGDIDRAYASNPHMSKEIIDRLRDRYWVTTILPEYDFDRMDDQKPVSDTGAAQDSDNKVEIDFWFG